MSEEHIREVVDSGSGAGAAPEQPSQDKESWGSFALFLVKLVIIVVLFRTFVFTSFNIPSESMMPRLLVGDYLFASKWSYGYSSNSLPFDLDLGDGTVFASQPERGEVVIFKHPIDRVDYIKRVIGLPGDKVQMIDGVLHLNDAPVGLERVEDFVLPVQDGMGCFRSDYAVQLEDGTRACSYPQFRETLPGGASYNILDLGTVAVDNTGPMVVPEGHYFLMGDNRDNSQDSRRPTQSGGWVGFVPQNDLVGEASFMYWSWGNGVRWDRIGRGI